MMARNCPRCFARVEGGVAACPHCGYDLDTEPRPTSRPEKATAEPAMVGRPLEPYAVASAQAREVAAAATAAPPWESRRALGFWSALWLTWRDSLFRPVPFFRRLAPSGGYGPALGYSILLTLIGFLFSSYWSVVEGLLAGSQGEEGGPLLILAGSFLALLLFLVVLIPLYVGLLYALVAIIHLGFVVVGAGRRGFEATFRAVAYSSGTAAFAIFPFFGPVLSSVWWAVVVFIAVREAQRTTNGRATLAFLIPVLVLVAFGAVLALLLQALLATLELPVTV